MRTINATLLFVLALAPLRAQTPALSAFDACKQLEAQARKLTSEKVRCEVGLDGLALSEVSASSLKALKKNLFPEQQYLGHAIVAAAALLPQAPRMPSALVIKAQATELKEAKARIENSPLLAQAAVANFDNNAAHLSQAGGTNTNAWEGLAGAKSETLTDAVADVPMVKADMSSVKSAKFLLVQQGPPGSGGGPPGSGNGPPGSGRDPQTRDPQRGGPPGSGKPPHQGPPGSGNPPGQTPPGGGSTPPSRPTPVWRSNFPPPSPNWWNTDFNSYDWWNNVPSGYDRPRMDQSNPDTFYYYSSWHRWRDVFITNWVRTEDSASISRTAANQQQIHSRSLTSQTYREAKECYYQAVYRYDWAQGGFNGSHWEERFDHYEARCIRLPREYGRIRIYTSQVSFDMGMVQGQDLPWESDVIRLTYDGTGQPRYDFSGAAYKYSPRLDDQRQGSESVTLIAGAKVLRAPESDKVQAFLRRSNGGKIELVINDDRASFYQGETLRVNARVVRRDVIKVPGVLWGWNEKNVDSVIHSSPVDILTGNSPQNITDLTGAASAPKPANFVRSSIFIESWEFSRVNSRISTGAVIHKGQGNAIAN